MPALNVILFLGFFLLSVLLLIRGVLLQRLGRHIAAQHPNLWKQIGSPDLNTAQGPRRDTLSEWIGKEKYLRINDPSLHRRGALLKKLNRLCSVWFVALFVSALVVILLNKFILA